MTEEQGGAAAEPSRTERIFIRISVLQTILAAAGIFTGAVALYAALNEADAVRKQQRAMVWPDMLIGSSYRADSAVPGGPITQIYSIGAVNSGIGPARVRAVRVRIDGQAQPDWASALTALGLAPQDFSTDLLSGRTLLSGDRVEALTVGGQQNARAMRQEINENGRLTIEACYCSVFDACWTVAFFSVAEPVDACPDYGDEAFTQ